MKRFLSAALALSLLAGTAAQADPFEHAYRDGRHDGYSHGFDRGYNRGYDNGYGNGFENGYDRDRRHHDNTGTAIAVGVGLIALTAILASQDHGDHDRERVYYRPAPPPAPDYGPGPRGPYGPGGYEGW